MPVSEPVAARIDEVFPASADREVARELLATLESERVQLAALGICRGQLERLRALVYDARRDFRDVIAAASQPSRRYIVGVLRKGPQWSEADENGRTHLDRALIRDWKKAGAVLVGGWFMEFTDPRGLYVFTLESIEETQQLVAQDPAIRDGRLVFEFHTWLAPELAIARTTM